MTNVLKTKTSPDRVFSLGERVRLLISLIKEDIFEGLSSNSDKEPKSPTKTRGNVMQRIGGVISDDEHEQIRKRAFPKK